jgi:hypothetical protein
LTKLLEQPRVLDGYDSLRRKVGDKLNLFVGERPHLLAVNTDGADQFAFFQHRYIKKAPRATEIGGRDA